MSSSAAAQRLSSAKQCRCRFIGGSMPTIKIRCEMLAFMVT